MINCWACTYSPCEGGRSKEHLISKSAFDQKMIFVQGFDWCRDKEVAIGLGSATAGVLCRKHNSLLDVVDRGGVSAIRSFDADREEGDPMVQGEVAIDGGLFERWLLKTAINVSYMSSLQIGVGMTDQQVGIPASYLVAVAFGACSFSHKMGAYFLLPSEEFRFRKGEITIMPVHKDGHIGGFYFHLRGVDVFLSLYAGHAPSSLRNLGVSSLPVHILDAVPTYRSTSLTISTNNNAFRGISFSWPAKTNG